MAKGGDGDIEDNILNEENFADDNFSHIVSLCQENLRSYQHEIQRNRQELTRLTRRLSKLEEEYTVASKKIAGYQQGCQELAADQEQTKQKLQVLEERQAVLKESQQELANESTPLGLKREELNRMLAAKRDSQAIIAELLAKQEELTTRLAGVSAQSQLTEQEKRIQEDIIDFETQLHSLDREKQKLIKCLSLLTAHKPETYILLSGSREQQLTTVAQYNQYLMEFVPVVQKIELQQQVPAAAFLSQDINLLLDKINILKQRQIDLKSAEVDTIDQVRELSQVLNDTAQDYGWTTSLLRPDPQGVSVNSQSISQLRQEANDLLVVAPPGILAKMGLCAQWKKTLFGLIVRAKSMEELAYSPAALRAQITAEVENVLLECSHLTQRIYEACYKHLSACGNSLDQEYNKIQAGITALTKQLLHSGKRVKQQIKSTAPPFVEDELSLRQSMQEIEVALQDARYDLQQQEAAINLFQESGAAVITDLNQEQAGWEDSLQQLDLLEAQKQQVITKLEQGSQQLAKLETKAVLAADKLAELAEAKASVSSQLEMITKQLEDSLSPDNEIRISLLTEWISRLHQYRPDSWESSAGVRGATQVRQKPSASADSIAQSLVKPGFVVLETREWLLPAAVMAVDFTLQGGRCYSPIEEFVMKCIASSLSELSSQAGIAELLRLPKNMVADTLASLCQWSLLRETKFDGISKYELIERGKEACQLGLVPAVLLAETVDIAVNAQYELIEVYKQNDGNCANTDCGLPVFRYCNLQEEQALRSYFPADNQTINAALEAKIKKWFIIDQQEYVTRLGQLQDKKECNLRFAEIWLYDVINNKVVCHVWNFVQQAFCEKLEFALNSLEGRHRLEQVQAALSKSKDWAALITKLRENQGGQPVIPESLYGVNRRNSLLKAIDDVQELLLLFVPDIAEIAADAEAVKRMRNAVNRGGIIFIGWGGAHKAADVQGQAAHASRLQNILDAEGLPGILIFDAGMLDSKMVLVVDNQYFLASWLPWISYCSKESTQHQAAIRISDKSQVKERSVTLQGLFLKQLEKQLLNGYLADEVNCITWFHALLKLSEHSYIREVLADEALDKVMTQQPDNTLLKLLAVYVKADKYDFGFEKLVLKLTAKPDAYTKLTFWLDKLRTRNLKAYRKIMHTTKGVIKRK